MLNICGRIDVEKKRENMFNMINLFILVSFSKY